LSLMASDCLFYQVMLALEEAMSNVCKYADDKVPTRVKVSTAPAELLRMAKPCHSGADGGLLLLVEVESTGPEGSRCLTRQEVQRAFETGFKGGANPLRGTNPYSNGVGLGTARDAVLAAGGSVELTSREDENGRVVTSFMLCVPARLEDAHIPQSDSLGRLAQADEFASKPTIRRVRRFCNRPQAEDELPSAHSSYASGPDAGAPALIAAAAPAPTYESPVAIEFALDALPRAPAPLLPWMSGRVTKAGGTKGESANGVGAKGGAKGGSKEAKNDVAIVRAAIAHAKKNPADTHDEGAVGSAGAVMRAPRRRRHTHDGDITPAPAPPTPAPAPKPLCVVVDDDALVQQVMLLQIESLGTHETEGLGLTLEQQHRMEDVIMGVRSARCLEELLPPPHVPAAVAILDLHFELPHGPEWRAAREDGRPMLPEDGLDLAERLRLRGFTGIIILHTGETAQRLEQIRRQNNTIDLFIEKGSAMRFKREFAHITARRS
jgi:hypothetical protein